MKKYLMAAFVMASFSVLGQNEQRGYNVSSKFDGTYQIEVLGRYQPLIPSNLSEIVAENRKPNEVTYVNLGTAVRVKILPQSELKSASSKPIGAEIINVESFK